MKGVDRAPVLASQVSQVPTPAWRTARTSRPAARNATERKRRETQGIDTDRHGGRGLSGTTDPSNRSRDDHL
jgi:hypothetical protein